MHWLEKSPFYEDFKKIILKIVDFLLSIFQWNFFRLSYLKFIFEKVRGV